MMYTVKIRIYLPDGQDMGLVAVSNQFTEPSAHKYAHDLALQAYGFEGKRWKWADNGRQILSLEHVKQYSPVVLILVA